MWPIDERVARALIGAMLLHGCASEVGPCDAVAADELVYGRNGLVATKGQALAHDSCGNGVFCHAQTASGALRFGAPAGLSFDMLPSPTGLSHVLDDVEALWTVVQDESMPPRGDAHRVQGDGDWTVDVQRHDAAPRLPSIDSREGKAVFRNWLACGAPVVVETQVPVWARPPVDPFAGDGVPAFADIHDVILKPNCALSGCHASQSAAGGLAFDDLCASYASLFESGDCGEPSVRAGDAAASLLIDKLSAEIPRCRGRMPPLGALPATYVDAIARWIDAGAPEATCAP